MYFHVSMVNVGNVNIPLDEEKELYYYGPLNDLFADSFLVASQEFLKANLETENVKKRKAIFLALVEMVQNISEYGKKHIEGILPRSCIMLNIYDSEVVIRTANMVFEENSKAIEKRFKELVLLSGEELNQQHKKALLNNESLGLYMIQKMEDSDLSWKIEKDDNNYIWLYLQLNVRYGDAAH